MPGRASGCKTLPVTTMNRKKRSGRDTALSIPWAPILALDKHNNGEPGQAAARGNPIYDSPRLDSLQGDRLERGKCELLRYGTWNIGTMKGRSVEVVRALSVRKVDVCCLQETRWKGSGNKLIGLENVKYKFLWQGCAESVAGVGVLLAEKWIDKVVDVKRVNERIMIVKLVVGKHIVNVISAYAPQSGNEEVVKDDWWDELLEICKNVPVEEEIILGGDLNGHVGAVSDGYVGVHGGHSFGTRNAEGERILEFCDALDMTVCNTLFKKDENKLVTYESGGMKSTVDYLLVKRRDRHAVQNAKVIPGEECVSQHKLVIGDIKIPRTKRSNKTFVPRLKVWKLKDDNEKERFAEAAAARSADIKEVNDVNKKWDMMKETLLKAAEEVCGWTKGLPRHKETWWWNDECQNARDEKERCFKVWKKTRLESDHEIYRTARKRANRACHEAQELERQRFADSLNSEEGKRNLYRITRQMTKRQDVINVNYLRDEKGKIISEGKKIKETWKSYMEKLLNEENVWDNNVDCDIVEGPRCEIKKCEVEEVLKRMKKGKAAGPTGVVAEMMKASQVLTVDWLTDLCNLIVSEGKIPDDWKKSVLVPVYKGKGDPMQCGSYRAIKLLEHAMKIVEMVMEKRIRKQVKIDDMQFGFREGKGTTDAVFILKQVHERYKTKGKNLIYAFVDLEKAFDRVPREVTRWALRKAGVDEWLVQSVMCMYEQAWTVVRTAEGETEPFEVKVGLHQGSILSPLLFIIVMDVVTREVREGLPWELLYADDLVLVAESEEELKEKLMKWKNSMESKGLKVNVAKTKVMMWRDGNREETGKWPCSICKKGVGRNSIECTTCKKWVHKKCSGVKGDLEKVCQKFICSRCVSGSNFEQSGLKEERFKVDEELSLEKVDRFCYLGELLSCNGDVDTAVTARMRGAWNKFRELSPILTAKKVSLKVKGKIYVSCVRSCMLYGSETWAVTAKEVSKLQRTEMRMIRWMSNVSLIDKKRSSEMRKKMGVEPIDVVMRRNRLRWFGHVQRRNEDEWLKRCTKMEVPGKKPRGRPRSTWIDVVNDDLRKLDLRVEEVVDRDSWRRAIYGKPANPGLPGKMPLNR